MQVMSKGDFARHIGVTPGRLSQYFTAGILDAAALEGEGRSARIRVPVAVEQIKVRRHVGQSLGNGLSTRLDLDGEAAPPAQPTASSPAAQQLRSDDVASQIQLERLESERRKNRLAAVDELASQKRLVPADQVRSEMTKLARQVDEENGAMIADFASAIASEFSVPQRDVLHLLRRVRNERKAVAADRLRANAQEVSETVEVVMSETSA
ncbi:MAG TPA: hypothetical protein VGO22_19265 [Pseudorhizobium sp.]|jgi:hypothetical protein|nr:hypothetical protein [Pseudorhizobium sp.]